MATRATQVSGANNLELGNQMLAQRHQTLSATKLSKPVNACSHIADDGPRLHLDVQSDFFPSDRCWHVHSRWRVARPRRWPHWRARTGKDGVLIGTPDTASACSGWWEAGSGVRERVPTQSDPVEVIADLQRDRHTGLDVEVVGSEVVCGA